MDSYEGQARMAADRATEMFGEENQVTAIGEGLGAIAYALLEVASAIRESTEARRGH
ncbi:hypothetical protein ACFC0K_37765 [Streptomyces hydrogenans]|uniref:hypothetical protein n=1 Tax=Streptomyces hydrogenans TaxID=1873719 RepID=UPI0035E1978C